MSLRVLVVGVGHLGRFHAQKLQQISEATLIGVVDSDAARTAAISTELGVPGFARMQDAPAHDAVVIATPTSAHFSVAREALLAGKHLFIEKPVLRTEEECAALEALAAERPQQLIQVGHIERFNPVVVAAERFGDVPWYVVAERLGPFKERGLDVDVLDDLMIHDLDLCLHWFKSEVVDVRAVGVSIFTHHMDMANARIEFASGAVASLTASRSSLESTRKLRLFTAARYLSLDLGAKAIKSVRRHPPKPDEAWPEIEMEPIEVSASDALFDEDRAFVTACLQGRPSPVPLADGTAAVRLAARVKAVLRTPGIHTVRA